VLSVIEGKITYASAVELPRTNITGPALVSHVDGAVTGFLVGAAATVSGAVDAVSAGFARVWRSHALTDATTMMHAITVWPVMRSIFPNERHPSTCEPVQRGGKRSPTRSQCHASQRTPVRGSFRGLY